MTKIADNVHNLLDGPREVIVRDHDGLRRACGSRGINQSRTVSRSNSTVASHEFRIRDISSDFKELVPGVHWYSALGCDCLIYRFVPYDDGLQVREFNTSVLLELLIAVDTDNLCLAVVRDVVTGLGEVSGVDTGGDTPRVYSAAVCNKPFRLNRTYKNN